MRPFLDSCVLVCIRDSSPMNDRTSYRVACASFNPNGRTYVDPGQFETLSERVAIGSTEFLDRVGAYRGRTRMALT